MSKNLSRADTSSQRSVKTTSSHGNLKSPQFHKGMSKEDKKKLKQQFLQVRDKYRANEQQATLKKSLKNIIQKHQPKKEDQENEKEDLSESIQVDRPLCQICNSHLFENQAFSSFGICEKCDKLNLDKPEGQREEFKGEIDNFHNLSILNISGVEAQPEISEKTPLFNEQSQGFFAQGDTLFNNNSIDNFNEETLAPYLTDTRPFDPCPIQQLQKIRERAELIQKQTQLMEKQAELYSNSIRKANSRLNLLTFVCAILFLLTISLFWAKKHFSLGEVRIPQISQRLTERFIEILEEEFQGVQQEFGEDALVEQSEMIIKINDLISEEVELVRERIEEELKDGKVLKGRGIKEKLNFFIKSVFVAYDGAIFQSQRGNEVLALVKNFEQYVSEFYEKIKI